MKKRFSVILAMDETNGIGKDGQLPWRLKADMALFKEVTTGKGSNAVIMGRKTWVSIPSKFRPLKDRFNIVMTRQVGWYQSPEARCCQVVGNFPQALKRAAKICTGEVFIIGGASVYEEALLHPNCDLVHLTRVEGDFGCDTHVVIPDNWIPAVEGPWQEETTKSGDVIRFRFDKLIRKGTI